MILCLSEQSRDDRKFGAAKLNKLLYFCDVLAYVKLGRPVTGVKYFRLGNGPAPKCFLAVCREMMEQGILELHVVPLITRNKPQERTVSLRHPNFNSFSPAEIELINSVLTEFRDYDSDEISYRSHNELGWMLMAERETIPYDLAFYSNPPLTGEEVERGRQLAASRRAA